MPISVVRPCPICNKSTIWEGEDLVTARCIKCNHGPSEEKKKKKEGFEAVIIPKTPTDIRR